MSDLKEKFITDSQGNRIGIVLDVAEYQRLLAALEELESIRAYDAAKASDDKAIPFNQAVSELTKDR